jgi:type-F conjugative transfer system pilin assembly protein TrbC
MIKSMNDRGMVIDIDPKTFHELGIHVVPAFVLSDGKKYDKIVGNLSIPYVLNKFAENGDLKEIAKKYLNRLKVKDANH